MKIDVEEKVREYIQNLLGMSLRLRPFAPIGLPFYVTNLYEFRTAELEKRRLLLCFPSGTELATPAQIMHHETLIRQACQLEVVFVLPELDSWNRKRLIEGRISFVVPGKQLYLPSLLIDLREHFAAEKKKAERLSFPGQYLLLYYLIHPSIEGRSVRELARNLQYSAISISRAVDELIQLGLAKTSLGKTKPLLFPLTKNKLWTAALPFLRSPVKSKRYWPAEKELPPWPKAGIAALAMLSELNEDSQDCRAVTQAQLKHSSDQGIVLPRARSERDALLEVWAYDPRGLGDAKTVDPFSLYLSLNAENDERIRKALDSLVKEAL